jgi:hypothetical protein
MTTGREEFEVNPRKSGGSVGSDCWKGPLWSVRFIKDLKDLSCNTVNMKLPNKLFEIMAEFGYLWTTVTDEN